MAKSKIRQKVDTKPKTSLGEYMKNITKSVGYFSIDAVAGLNPSIKNFADSNSDISKTIYAGIKDYKNIIKNTKTAVKESDYYKIGKMGVTNAIDDLKTGKLYNKERIDAANTKLAMGGGDDDDFFDFDFDMDFDFDDDENKDEVIDKGDKYLAKEINDSNRALASSLGTTTVESAKYIAGTQKASTKMLYDQNNRLLGGLNITMSSVAANMQQIVAQQESIQTHMQNSQTFFENASKQMATTNELLVKIIENQEKANNAGVMEKDEKERIKYTDIDNGMGGLDLKAYASVIKKNARSLGGGTLGLLNMFEGGNILETFAASPIQTIMEPIIQKAIPEMIKETSKSLNDSIAGLFGSFQASLNKLDEDNILYKLLHVDNRLKTTIDPSQYFKGQQAWNGVDHKALTEVIPDQLGEIISILSGTEKRLFDYNKGVYKTVSSIKEDYDKNLRNAGISAGSDIKEQMKLFMSGISFQNKSFKEGLEKSIDTMLANAFKNGKLIDMYDNDFDFSELGVDRQYERYIRSMLKNVDRSKMVKYNTSRMEARERWTQMMKEEEKQGSIYRHKFNNSEMPHIKKDKDGKILNDKDTSLIARLSINRVTDDHGHNVFYYLQNMYKELTYIRQSNGYTPGAGGTGGYGRNLEITRTDSNGNERTIYTGVNGNRLRYEDVHIDNIRSREEDRKSQQYYTELARYQSKVDKERESDKKLRYSEKLDDLDDLHFDRSIQAIAEEVREREKLTHVKTPATLSTLDELVKAETFSEKVGVINNNFKALLRKPADILASSMQAADKAIYTLIYGDKRNKDGSRKGFMNEMMDQMRYTFTKFHNWMDSLLDPLKEKLGVNQFREIPGKVFEKFFGMTPHEAYEDFKTYLFGEFEEDADGNKYRTKDGLFSGFTDGIKEAFSDAGNFVKEAFKPITDFIDGKRKPKENNTEENSIIDPVSELENSSSQIRERILSERNKKLQAIATEREKLINSGEDVNYDNAYLYANILGIDEESDFDDLLKKSREKSKQLRKSYGRDLYRKTVAGKSTDAMELLREGVEDNTDILNILLGDNEYNRKYSKKLAVFGGANGINIDNLTVKDLSDLIYNKNVSTKILNNSLKKKLDELMKNDESISSMTFNELKGSIRNGYINLNPSSPAEVARSINDASGRELEIARVFEGLDDSVDGIGHSLDNTENILEDILDAVRHIAKSRGFQNEKRSRRQINKIYSRDEVIEEAESNSIETMAYGGRVVKSGPVILSEGEYVFNPADDETKKKQKANEERIARKLGFKNILKLAEADKDGTRVEFDDNSTTEDHFVETRNINGKDVDIYEFEGIEYYRPNKRRKAEWKRVEDDGLIYVQKNRNTMTQLNRKKFSGFRSKLIDDVDAGKYKEGEEPLAYKTYTTLSEAVNSTARAIGITKDDEDALGKATADVMSHIREYAPYAIGTGLIGGGVSLVTGMIGGPLLGAATGAALGLVHKSDKVQDWLFGKLGDDGEREGGVISKEVQQNIHKYVPDMAKGGILGGAGGLITGLISPLGPVGGIILGSAIGFAKNNDSIKKELFGEDWENKSKDFGKKLKALVPAGIAGALVGSVGLSGTVGLVPALVLGSLSGFALTTEKMKRMLFGDLDENGKRDNTGLLGAIKEGIVEPIKQHSGDLFKSIKKWVHDDIFDPVKRSIAPMIKSITNIGKSIFGFIGNRIDGAFDRGISAVFAKWLKDNLIGKAARGAGKVGGLLLSPAKYAVSAPFRMVGAVGDSLRSRQIARGQADYMSAEERLQFRQDRKEKRKNGLLGRTRNALRFGRPIKKDRFEKFDQYLNNADEAQLLELREQIKGYQDPSNYLLKDSADAERELRENIYALNNGINFDEASDIEAAIKEGNYDKARTIIGNAQGLNPFTRDRLMDKIFSSGARFNSIEQNRNEFKRQGKLTLNAIRMGSGGLFKGLKSYKDLDKYQDYLNKEINVREQKSDVEKQTEAQAKQHKEIVDLFKAANERLRAISDPDYAAQLNREERSKAIEAANKRFGFGAIRNRSSDRLMYDYRQVTDEDGNSHEELVYVGPGSKYFRDEHPDEFNEDGSYRYSHLTGRPGDTRYGHWMANDINDSAYSHMINDDMDEDEAKELARSEMTGSYLNRVRNRRSARNNIQIINYAKDLAINAEGSDENYKDYLEQARNEITNKHGRVTRKGRLRARTVNETAITSQLQRAYINNGQSEEDARYLAQDDVNSSKKKPWYRFVGTRRFRMTYDADGSPIIDKSDSSSIKNASEIDKAEEVQSKTYTVMSSIDSGIRGFFGRLFGKGDEDEGKSPFWKRLLGTGTKILGIWTLLSLGPFAKKLWQDTISPAISETLGKVISPIAPAIENIALKLDNFFLNIFPNTIRGIGRNVIGWLTGSGEYEGSGLPYVFKDKIIPFYMGGIEFLMDDVIPNTVGLIFKHLPTMLMNTLSNISKMWSWSLEDILSGKPKTNNNTASISSEGIVDNIANYEYTPKTGPFYSAYKSIFGGSGSSTKLSGETVQIQNSNNGDSSSSGLSENKETLSYKVKDMLGLNKRKTTAVAKSSTVDTNSDSVVIIGDNNVPSSGVSGSKSKTYNNRNTTKNVSRQYDPNDMVSGYDASNYEGLAGNSATGEVYSEPFKDMQYYDNGDGTATATDSAGNTYTQDADGTIWIMDSNGNSIQVSTNQKYHWSAYDGLYHGFDSNGNEVTLTTTQLLSSSLTEMNSDLYSSLQDNRAKGKSVVEQFKIGSERGHVGYAIIRSFVNGSSGALGALTKVGAKSGFIVKSVTAPIRGIGKVASISGNAGRSLSNSMSSLNSLRKSARAISQAAPEGLANKAIKTEARNTAMKSVRGAAQELALVDPSAKYDQLKDIYKREYKLASKNLKTAAKEGAVEFSDETLEKLANTGIKSTDELSEKVIKEISEAGSSSGFISKITKKLTDVCCNSKMIAILSKFGGNFSETAWNKAMNNAGKELGEKLGAKLLGKGVQGAAKFLGKFSPVAIAFIISDFYKGWDNAQVNLGIMREPTVLEKALSGLITVINSYVTLGLLPESVIYSVVIDNDPFGWFTELKQERAESDEFTELYNEINGTNYSSTSAMLEDNKKSLWQKFKESVGIEEKDTTFEDNKKKVYEQLKVRDVATSSRQVTDYSSLSFLKNVDLSGTGSGLNLNTATPKGAAESIKSGTFISQYDSQFANTPFNIKGDTEKQTVSSSGCGPASAAMVLNDATYGVDKASKEVSSKNQLMEESIKYALNSKYKVKNGGVTPDYFTDYFKSKGLNSVRYNNATDVNSQLELGSRMIVLGKDKNNKSKSNSPFGPNGHYVVVNGVSKDNRYVYVNDPELQVSNVPYEKNYFLKGVQMGIKAIDITGKSGYNVGKDFTSGSGNVYDDPLVAALYQDLCCWSPVSKNTLRRALYKLVKVKNPRKNILANKAEIFLTASKETELDPRFLIALAIVVSNSGTNDFVATYNNPFAIKNSSDEYVLFASIEDGIIEGAKYIKHIYYMKGKRFSMIQMAKESYYGCSGSSYNPFDGWENKVAKLLCDSKMPNNSKADTYLNGPYGTKDTTPNVTGEAVYKDSVTATSIVTKISSILTNMFNAIYGFDTSDSEFKYKDDNSAGDYIHANGHPYTCFCKECHPEMYDKNGNPTSIRAIIYQYANDLYNDNTDSETGSKSKSSKKKNSSTDEYSYENLVSKKIRNQYMQKAIAKAGSRPDLIMKYYHEMMKKDFGSLSKKQIQQTNIIQQLYSLAGFKDDQMNKFDEVISSEDTSLRSVYSKLFLLGALSKKGLVDLQTEAPNSMSSPLLSDKFVSRWKFSPSYKDINYANMHSLSELFENGYNVYDVNNPSGGINGKVGLTIYQAKNLYNMMRMRYARLYNSDYSGKKNYGSVEEYYKAAKEIYKSMNDDKNNLYGGQIGYEYDSYNTTSKKLHDKLIYQDSPISTSMIQRKSLFAKTKTFNPKDIEELTLSPYRKPNSKSPDFFLSNALAKNDKKSVFTSSFMGIPVYGVYGGDNGWSLVDFNDPDSEYYKNSFGAWELSSNLESFKSSIGLKSTNKPKYDLYNSSGLLNSDQYKYSINKGGKYTDEQLGIDSSKLVQKTVLTGPTYTFKYITKDGTVKTVTLDPSDSSINKLLYTQYDTAVRSNIEAESNNKKESKDDYTDGSDTVTGIVKNANDAYNNAKQVAKDYMGIDTDGTLTEQYSDAVGDGSGLGGSFVSQLDPRISNIRFNTSRDTVKQTIGDAGCAPAVATMAINGYTGGASMADMSKYALKYKVKNGGTSSDYFSDVFAKNGISSSYTTSTSDIKSSLRSGKSVVLLGQDSGNTSKANSPFGPGGHYVLANGISADGSKIYINDPESNRPNIPYSSKILKNTNLGVTVGGSSRLVRRGFSGMGSYKKETRSKKDIQRQNLAKFSPVTAEQMNAWIASKNSSSPFNGHGDYFIEASEKSGLDPRYLLAHAAVESGWGTSRISQKYHNYFGIGAFDSNPDNSKNYNNNGMRAGIVNGAIWIAKNYYSSKYKQTSIYKMRYNNGVHQYCTSTTWVDSISSIMASGPKNTKFSYDLSPSEIKQGSYVSGSSGDSSSSSTSSSSSKSSSIIGEFTSKISNMFNAAFGYDTSSGSESSSGSVSGTSDGSWVSTVKAVKKAMATGSGKYLQGGSVNITIDGKKINARTDCSGFVSACLNAIGAITGKFTSRNYTSPSADLSKALKKAGFKKLSWSGWDSLVKGDIIAKVGHVEIFSHNKNGLHYVFNYGGSKSAPVKGATVTGHNEGYTTVWRKSSGSGSGIYDEDYSLLDATGSFMEYTLAGSGFKQKDQSSIPLNKSESHKRADNIARLRNIFSSYYDTSGKGSNILSTMSNFNTNNYSGNGLSLTPEIVKLLAACTKSMNKVAKNSDQIKTIVSLLTKILAKNNGSGSGSGMSKQSNTNNQTQTPIIVNTTDNSDDDFEDAGLEKLIRQLSELAQ